MSKKLITLAVVMSFALIGGAFAAVEDIKVSGDITAQTITRDLSLGLDTIGESENYLFSQVRLRFDADLTEEVSAVIQLINERLWDAEGAADTDMDLDLAYVKMGQMLYEPLTVIIGRQNLRYGNALIVGDPDTNQTVSAAGISQSGDLSLRKSFDAVRAILDYAPYTIDLVYARVAENTVTEADDVTLMGANLSYQWDSYNGVTEAYIFGVENTRNQTTSAFLTAAVPENKSNTFAVGTRSQADLNDNVTLGGEVAYQFGDVSHLDKDLDGNADTPTEFGQLSAWAVQLMSEYRFLNDYDAKIGATYTFLSGDDDTADDNYKAWDPMFEDQSPAEILNILGANTNAHFFTVSTSMMPREDVTVGLLYAKAVLAEKWNYSTWSPITGPATANTYAVDRDNANIGDELDMFAVYDYTEDVQMKLSAAAFLPGSFFTSANDDVAYSVRGSVAVLF